MSPLLRAVALYSRCRRATTDMDVDVESYGGLRWRVGLEFESRVRARGMTLESNEDALTRALEDLSVFLRVSRERRSA